MKPRHFLRIVGAVALCTRPEYADLRVLVAVLLVLAGIGWICGRTTKATP